MEKRSDIGRSPSLGGFFEGDEDRYLMAQRLLDIPMMLFALAFVVIFGFEQFADVSEGASQNLQWASRVIWASFGIEYVLLLRLAPDKKEMVRTHKLDLALLVLPWFRVLRILRALRAFRGLRSGIAVAKRVMERRGLDWILLAVSGVMVGGASLTFLFERDEPSADIDSWGTALWWAVVTCTTVGYGDVTPVSSAGRIVAGFLMIVGVALLSLVTANIASVFVENDSSDELARLETGQAELITKLDRVLLELESDDR